MMLLELGLSGSELGLNIEKPRGSYKSLLERIPFDGDLESYPRLRYEGTLEGVLTELEAALSPSAQTSAPFSSTSTLILHPPRIIRAAIDYKVAHPGIKGPETLVRDAVGLGLDIYRGSKSSAARLRSFRDRVAASNMKDLLTATLVQPDDFATWMATDPVLSQASAERLMQKTQGQDVLLIAMAHGGVAAGMDVFLRYCDLAESPNSQFFPCRFSVHKIGDGIPQVTDGELTYLRQEAKGKRIVVFDEDAATGETSRAATSFFSHVFSQEGQIIPLTNLDLVADLKKQGFKFNDDKKNHNKILTTYLENKEFSEKIITLEHNKKLKNHA